MLEQDELHVQVQAHILLVNIYPQIGICLYATWSCPLLSITGYVIL